MATSVLIVNYKAYDELAACLDSLAPTLGRSDEVIVVDHESDSAVVTALQARFPSVRFVPDPSNRGFAAGVNAAARQARGQYLLVLNPDTHVREPIAAVLAAWMERHPEVGVAGPRIENADGTIQPSARRFPGASTLFGGRSTWLTRRFPDNWFTRRNLIARHTREEMRVDWVSGACMMTRRDVFERLGGLDEGFFMYWEDADYCRRALLAGYEVAFVPSATVVHAAGRSARYNVARAIHAFHQSAFRLYWKHSGPVARLAAPLVWVGLRARGVLRIAQAKANRG